MSNTHLKPRTIREWLELIPFDRARREAIDNYDYDPLYSEKLFQSVSHALQCAFYWDETEQGCDYWRDLNISLQRMEQSVKLKQPK